MNGNSKFENTNKSAFSKGVKGLRLCGGKSDQGPQGPPGKRPNLNKRPADLLGKIDLAGDRKKLPIFVHRDKLANFIRQNKTLIILGEPGCGKTTQLPQYINEAGINGKNQIGITQPRRVAAISVATRVAQEYDSNTPLGDYVGYSVRFEDVTSERTKIKFLTDGMLLREAINDDLLLKYSVIILDEAHERTIHTDVLFGIVKNAQRVRENRNLPQLRVIITSATMDVDHFAEYFDNCKVIYIEGRTYPIKVHFTAAPQNDYQTACVRTFFQIHQKAPWNEDVLIFLTGQEEIESCASRIRLLAKDKEVDGPPVKVCPLYAAQPTTQQMAVFGRAPAGTRKVVISTNIAETSVTIKGITYVIDSGMVKVRSFHPSTGLEIMKVQRVSREQADQRTGRCGREARGICYRVYTRLEYEQLMKSTIPEIQKANLNSVALQLLALGVHILNFDFLDKPSEETLQAAFEQLKMLGAIEDIYCLSLTPLGKRMVQFPIDPRFSKIILSAEKFGCVKEAIEVVALLSSESVLLNPPTQREGAQEARLKFRTGYGDHLTLLNIYRRFSSVTRANVKLWCQEHYINMRNILYVREVVQQLTEICKKNGMEISTCSSDMSKLRKCLLSGLFMNVAELQKDLQYVTLDKHQSTLIHPSSVLYRQHPGYVIFTEVVQTSKCYLRNVTSVESSWFNDVAPEYFSSRNVSGKPL